MSPSETICVLQQTRSRGNKCIIIISWSDKEIAHHLLRLVSSLIQRYSPLSGQVGPTMTNCNIRASSEPDRERMWLRDGRIFVVLYGDFMMYSTLDWALSVFSGSGSSHISMSTLSIICPDCVRQVGWTFQRVVRGLIPSTVHVVNSGRRHRGDHILPRHQSCLYTAQ